MKCRRLLCLGMAAALACAGMPGMTAAAGETRAMEDGVEAVGAVEGNFEYEELEDGTLEITGYDGNDTELVIPSEIGGKSVTSIGYRAFYLCSGLTSVSIPESVTSIGEFAFGSCSGLTSVSIPESVTSIGEYAFRGCSGLTSVSIGEGVTSIGEYAFSDCSGLTSVSVPESVTSIGEYAFSGCSGLTGFNVSGENASYASENGMLYNKEKTELLCCPGGKKGSVSIPESVTSIGSGAFWGCSGLTSVIIPGSVTSIGGRAFLGCSGLTSVSIGEGVTSIGEYAFSRCSGLTSVIIPGSVTSIGEYAFDLCSGLTSVIIPGSVTSIGKYAFSSCSGLTSVIIPGDVTSIEKGVFSDCSGLTSVIIPEGVTSIGGAAFWGCSGLTSVSIPGSVTSIGYGVFSDCGGLKDVYYGGSEELWHKIAIGGSNDALSSAAIHYNLSGEQKKAQSITARDMTKTYGEKPFSLGTTALGGAALTYTSSNAKVASVASNGTVTLKGCGVAAITVTAAETKDYKAASMTVTLTVKPKKATLVSVKSKPKKTALVKWKKDAKASGYLIECATDKKFKKNKVKTTVGKNKTVSATVKKLKGGKKYYVRICAYAKDGKKKIQGDWSKPKTVKVKK